MSRMLAISLARAQQQRADAKFRLYRAGRSISSVDVDGVRCQIVPGVYYAMEKVENLIHVVMDAITEIRQGIFSRYEGCQHRGVCARQERESGPHDAFLQIGIAWLAEGIAKGIGDKQGSWRPNLPGDLV